MPAFDSRQSVELRIEVDDDYLSPIIRRKPIQLELNESVYSAFKEGDETKSELSFCEYDNGPDFDLQMVDVDDLNVVVSEEQRLVDESWSKLLLKQK